MICEKCNGGGLVCLTICEDCKGTGKIMEEETLDTVEEEVKESFTEDSGENGEVPEVVEEVLPE